MFSFSKINGSSKVNFPLLTKIMSSTNSFSFIKTTFLNAIIGLNDKITLTLKSILTKNF